MNAGTTNRSIPVLGQPLGHGKPQRRKIVLTGGYLLVAWAMLAVSSLVLAAGQQKIPDYETARGIFWRQLYKNAGTSLYCGQQMKNRRHRGMNIEHVFPMSWVTRSLRCGNRSQCRNRNQLFNHIEADLHNLYPALIRINKARSSFPFAMVAGEKRRFQRCDFEVNEFKRIVEPRPAVRGNIARAVFYMSYTYRLPLYRKQKNLLLKWHVQDPPDRNEQRRNALIERLEGVRNPFIDHPAAARRMLVNAR